MEEIWKNVNGYPNYMVSNNGSVKCLNFRGNTNKEIILKPIKQRTGYYHITLCKEGITKQKLIHRLVYEAFVGEIPDGIQVNHINEDKTDNRLENLNLMKPKENTNWGTANERRIKKQKGKHLSEETKKKISEIHKGKYNTKKSKSVLQIDKDTNEVIAEFPSTMEIERQLGFLHSNISYCCNGKQKLAYGYKWQFKTTT